MLAIAGGILIAIGVIAALVIGGVVLASGVNEDSDGAKGCGIIILLAVAAFVAFVIF